MGIEKDDWISVHIHPSIPILLPIFSLRLFLGKSPIQ